MPDPSPILRLEKVSKRFSGHGYAKSAFSLLASCFRGGFRDGEAWPLRDVSFDVLRGERIGIVGANGSGKTTLLKIIGGLYRPTEGRVQVFGRTACVLQLGVGMERELSASENIRIFGAILGIDERTLKLHWDGIAAFAELENDLHRPLKDFSFGMVQRLVFSVVRYAVADILVLDEILAAGDPGFVGKSLEALEVYRQRNRAAVILTSHNAEILARFCDKLLWIDEGHRVAFGPVDEVLAMYLHRAPVSMGANSVKGACSSVV